MKTRIFFLTLIIVTVSFYGMPHPTSAQAPAEVVSVLDANLAAALWRALDLAPGDAITSQAMLTLTSLQSTVV